MRRPCVFALVIFLLLLPAVVAENSVVRGEEIWQIILTPVSGSFRNLEFFRDYSNESNVQRILEATPQRVVIERRVNYAPFMPEITLADTKDYNENPECSDYLEKPESTLLRSRADKLVRGLTTQLEYVNAVMYEVRDRLVWRSSPIVDAEAVYKSGFALCAGFANLAVALLRAQGIPARVAHVLALKHPSWNEGGHAEVEVYYEGSGWVSYDPQMHAHHGPFPRIYYGNSEEATIYSTNKKLWASTMYFGKLSYNVQYREIKNDVTLVALRDKPSSSDFVTRDDGFGTQIPSIGGTVYDGAGNPSTREWLYCTLNPSGNSYDGSSLRNGSYVIKNDADGGRLFMDEKGFAVFYHFEGYDSTDFIPHDIRFDETDSIIVKSGKPNSSVKWFFKPSSYYTFKADASGILRLHVNPVPAGYKVNDDTYVFSEGTWKKKR